jgi:hypothetical protein
MFMITCNVSLLDDPNLESSKSRKIMHAIYDYPKVMEMSGNHVTDKLVTFVINKLIPMSVPPMLKTALGLGTAGIRVTYPKVNDDASIIAVVEIISNVQDDLKYRTLVIRRFKTNSPTSLDL